MPQEDLTGWLCGNYHHRIRNIFLAIQMRTMHYNYLGASEQCVTEERRSIRKSHSIRKFELASTVVSEETKLIVIVESV